MPLTTDKYTSSTTWVCPDNVSSIDVECWGGGGGGNDVHNTNTGGYGGGGGAYAKKISISVTPRSSYTVTVGIGGQGNHPAMGSPTSGGDSWFNTITTVLAKGGSLGGDYSGQGGQSSSCIGDTKYSGGNGGAGGNLLAGGGGGGAGTTGNGYSGNGATGGAGGSLYGGNGGNGNTPNGGDGGGGGVIGGGGGAELGDFWSGGGANGALWITYYTLVITQDTVALTTVYKPYITISNITPMALVTELEPNKWSKEPQNTSTWVKESTHDDLYIS